MNQGKKILIVEDDIELANILGRSFEIRGYQARIANSTKEAIADLKKFHPNYAVVDLKMPGDSGLECIRQLNQFDQKIKIVMLTGYASITTTIEAIKLGACYYLAKPTNVEIIINAFNDEAKQVKTPLLTRKTSIKNLEWEYINQILVESNFNISKTARILGMHRRTLSRKLEKRLFPN